VGETWLETWLIIILLGGLEFTLWYIEHRRHKQIEAKDTIEQQRQTELLDGILTELSIANSEDVVPDKNTESVDA
jgi:hypothetical protein